MYFALKHSLLLVHPCFRFKKKKKKLTQKVIFVYISLNLPQNI